MSLRLQIAFAALAVCTACAGQRIEPVLDLTPWTWTWSQTTLGGWVIRYGSPDEASPALAAGDPAASATTPVAAGMLRMDSSASGAQARVGSARATHFAAFRYGCAREDRAERAACSVFLDFWFLESEPPLAAYTLPMYAARFESLHPDAPPPLDALTRDSHGREWLHRTLTLRSGAAFSHYSRPLDRRFALAVTSYTTRAPDRLVARNLARDAIERIRFEAAP